MTKLYKLVSEIKEDECVLEEIEPEQEEKDKMVFAALEKIKAETKSGQFSEKRRRPHRKIVVLAAAIISVMAFGAVAYATDLFGFGKITYYGKEMEIISPENSNQYKAIKEYQDYRNGLPKKELMKLEKERTQASKGAMTEESFTWHYFAPAKIEELCRKYNLRCNQKDFYVSSAQEAFDQANMENFFGKFTDSGGQFSYGDQGTVSMSLDKGDTCFDIFCIPNDVFYINSWADPWEGTDMKQWEYPTKSGYTAKCAMYNDHLGENGEALEECYQIAVLTENYVVTMHINDSAKDNKLSHSKEKLEKIIDQFDFSKLK